MQLLSSFGRAECRYACIHHALYICWLHGTWVTRVSSETLTSICGMGAAGHWTFSPSILTSRRRRTYDNNGSIDISSSLFLLNHVRVLNWVLFLKMTATFAFSVCNKFDKLSTKLKRLNDKFYFSIILRSIDVYISHHISFHWYGVINLPRSVTINLTSSFSSNSKLHVIYRSLLLITFL